MRSPADMKIIQVDITNACDKRCSNCTRFCGNHKETFFMDIDTFKRALDSLDGYSGAIGIIGGEPTLHPLFEQFALHIRDKYGYPKYPNHLINPQTDFIKEIQYRDFESRHQKKIAGKQQFEPQGPGLWSNMGASYRKHYELIQDVFLLQLLNDHINPSYHQPGLISRKDLGIPDDVWIPMRDACWMQNEWSATITPKGAFFCEVAGALDMLFDGPGGWVIEPDWWKRNPDEFGEQLNWCEICGFALNTFSRNAEDDIDDVSQTLYEKLKDIGSPRLNSGKINLIDTKDKLASGQNIAHRKEFSSDRPYLELYNDRFSAANSVLYVKEYEEISIADGVDFGTLLNKVLLNTKEWILFKTNPSNADIQELLDKYILNPGTLHIGDGFAIFSKNAMSLRVYGLDRIARLQSWSSFVKMWQPGKVVCLSDAVKPPVRKRNAIMPNMKYAIWGAGLSGGLFSDMVIDSGGVLVCIADKDNTKHGTRFNGVEIKPPEYLADNPDDYDFVIIANYRLFEVIKQNAIDIGIDECKILLPYDI